jgi:predicted TIM-barrel fold metal-dependent hydrolase
MDFSRFANLKVIDGHVHFRDVRWTDALLEWMDQAGLASVNLVSTPNLETINQNAELVYLKARHPGRFYASGGLDYVQALADRAHMSELLGAQIRTLHNAGFDGLKLIEGKPTARQRLGIPLDAREYAGMWAALEELQMPIVCHVADPEEFWDRDRVPSWALTRGWFYGDEPYPAKEALYAEMDNVLARHPTLRLILAHFYFLSADLERAARLLDAYPSLCLDITPGGEMYNHFTRSHEASRAFFMRYQDRIVYGTDVSTRAIGQNGVQIALSFAHHVRTFLETAAPFAPPPLMPHWLEDDLEALVPIELPEDVLAKIYHGNFERLYGADPAPLNREAAFAELERIAGEIDAQQGPGSENPARDVLNRLM